MKSFLEIEDDDDKDIPTHSAAVREAVHYEIGKLVRFHLPIPPKTQPSSLPPPSSSPLPSLSATNGEESGGDSDEIEQNGGSHESKKEKEEDQWRFSGREGSIVIVCELCKVRFHTIHHTIQSITLSSIILLVVW